MVKKTNKPQDDDSFASVVELLKEEKTRDIADLALQGIQARDGKKRTDLDKQKADLDKERFELEKERTEKTKEIAGEDNDKQEKQLNEINETLLSIKDILSGKIQSTSIDQTKTIEPSRLNNKTAALFQPTQPGDISPTSVDPTTLVEKLTERKEEFKERSTQVDLQEETLQTQKSILSVSRDHIALFSEYLDIYKKDNKDIKNLLKTSGEQQAGSGGIFSSILKALGIGATGAAGGALAAKAAGAGGAAAGTATTASRIAKLGALAKSPVGKVLGPAVAVAAGGISAATYYGRAEDKKQQDLQNIEAAEARGEITPQEAKKLKKDVASTATEMKGGAIGEGTGLAAGAIGGGIAGAKVGATVGTFFGGPLGTAVGGVIGGIGGSIVGAISGSSVGRNIGGVLGAGVGFAKRITGLDDTTSERKKAMQEAGKRSQTSTQLIVSERTFAEKDPENFQKYQEFKQKRTQEIYDQEIQNYSKTLQKDPVIQRQVRADAGSKAKTDAVKKFKKELEKAGAVQESKLTKEDRKLLDFVAEKESGGDYTAMFGEGSKKDLTDMTVKQVMDYQKGKTDRGAVSSAAGKYQFIRSTLSEEAQAAGIDVEREKFTPELQDRLMLQRLKRVRGLDQYRSGELSKEQFAENLSMEFASLPSPGRGGGQRSYYEGVAGNKALVGMKDVYSQLDSQPTKDGTGIAQAAKAQDTTDPLTSKVLEKARQTKDGTGIGDAIARQEGRVARSLQARSNQQSELKSIESTQDKPSFGDKLKSFFGFGGKKEEQKGGPNWEAYKKDYKESTPVDHLEQQFPGIGDEFRKLAKSSTPRSDSLTSIQIHERALAARAMANLSKTKEEPKQRQSGIGDAIARQERGLGLASRAQRVSGEQSQGQRLREEATKLGLDPNKVKGKLEGGVLTTITDESGKSHKVAVSEKDQRNVDAARTIKASNEQSAIIAQQANQSASVEPVATSGRSTIAMEETSRNRTLEREANRPQAVPIVQPIVSSNVVNNNTNKFVPIKASVRPENKGSALTRYQDRTHVY